MMNHLKLQSIMLLLATVSAFQGTTRSLSPAVPTTEQGARITTSLYYQDNSQDDVDAYLKFLDRRYNRLHGEEKRSPKELARNANDSELMVSATCECEDGDALCVLGVADLASKKLQQRRQRASKDSYPNRGTVLSSTSVPVATLMSVAAIPSPTVVSSMVAKVAPFLKFIYHQRRKLITQQAEQLKVVVAFLSRTGGIDGIKSAKAIWQVGGGKKNIAWTFTVMIALAFLLLRPLAQAIAGKQQETLLVI